ncbi:beta-mannosidase-like [Euwallacea similis]|uniref:beta-mannosidase-like n=1 Tax=Euwallacea similis TaxID=1736056 RepID=UPI00344FA5D6
MMKTVSCLCCFAAFWASIQAKSSVSQSLDGTWFGAEKEYYYEFPATVPGGIYSDMMDLKIIDDIFTFYHDNDTKWVGTNNWTYALNFTIDEGLLDYEHVNLVFDGVDTFADIQLNNVSIGSTQNMFIRYSFDVKNILKSKGNNTVRIWFQNSIEVGNKLNTEQLKRYLIPLECPPDSYRGDCHINMMRKMQASYSWDWGPSFPSMGIWKPVYLQAFDDGAIEHVITRMEKNLEDNESYLLIIDTYFVPNKNKSLTGTLNATIHMKDAKIVSKSFEVQETANEHGEILKSVSLFIEKSLVDLWWPNGYGNQSLYEIVVAFTSSLDNSISSKKIKTGFRFVELVEKPLDTGATFYLKVNGEPIFAKGSNEIPINILPEYGQNRQKIRNLLQSAKDVNMNMLRVWGGGVYESDYFYEVADELGIMIWQDFMFACALYPTNEYYLSNVAAEVNHNVKRLYYHPSIVIYAGNNENEIILADNRFDTDGELFDTYKNDYVALYIDTIKAEFDRISGGEGLFVSSSPSNGNLTRSEGWVGSSPGNQYWGDVHHYDYSKDPWDSNNFPIPRFCSEYGYQSLPFEASWLSDATNTTTDLNINGTFMDWRQHHDTGNNQMAVLLSHNLNLPDAQSNIYTSAFIYMSEVYASQGIKVETEHYRRYRSYLTEDGKGLTMGALYWQLNDVWVAPTWSSIDYTGRWKMLHYFAKDFFANVIITGHINSDRQLQIYTVNDKLGPVNSVTAVISVYKYDNPDFTPLLEDRISLNLNASASELVQTLEVDDYLTEAKCDSTSCFFYLVVRENTTDVAITPENYVFPGKLKESKLGDATVKIESVTQSSPKFYNVTVTSNNIALFVWLDSQEIIGTFSQNGFLQIEEKKIVTFKSDQDTTLDDVKMALSVTHLKDPKWE